MGTTVANIIPEDELPVVKTEDIDPDHTIGGDIPEDEGTENNDEPYGDDVNFITGPDGEVILPDEEDHEDDDVVEDDDEEAFDVDEDDDEEEDDEDEDFDEDAAFEEDDYDDGEQFL